MLKYSIPVTKMDTDAQISQQILNKYKTLLSQTKKQN